jgi:hypothetical protein
MCIEVIKKIFFLSIILFYNKSIFCDSPLEPFLNKIVLSDAQLAYLKENSDSATILLLLNQNQKLSVQIADLKKKIDELNNKNNPILETIQKLKKERSGCYEHSAEYRILNDTIMQLYKKIQ